VEMRASISAKRDLAKQMSDNMARMAQVASVVSSSESWRPNQRHGPAARRPQLLSLSRIVDDPDCRDLVESF
jgi:hypothetical protein